MRLFPFPQIAPIPATKVVYRCFSLLICVLHTTSPRYNSSITAMVSLFQPKAPHKKWRRNPGWNAAPFSISIHALRTGSDEHLFVLCVGITHFNPRSPCVERPCLHPPSTLPPISIHAPRAGSDACNQSAHLIRGISIHAPRAGSDPVAVRRDYKAGISIHAPRAGSDNAFRHRKHVQ
jgi:hypothetical protein